MVHYLTHHVRERHTLRLEEAIRKMTSLPATRFELPGRGLLHADGSADVVVFDYDALDDGSTLEQPLAYCRGVEHVLVNGRPSSGRRAHRRPTGARPAPAMTTSRCPPASPAPRPLSPPRRRATRRRRRR